MSVVKIYMTYLLKSQDVVITNGKKTVRKVHIKDGKGYKSISTYRGRKHLGTVKRPISTPHVKLIQGGKFVKSLFKDCKNCNKSNKSNTSDK